jgi:hypothetical protein
MAKRTALTMTKDLYTLYMSLNDYDDLADVSDYISSKIVKKCLDNKMSLDDVRLEIKNTLDI